MRISGKGVKYISHHERGVDGFGAQAPKIPTHFHGIVCYTMTVPKNDTGVKLLSFQHDT